MAARLRILTANLWNGAADPAALARLLRDEAVDVACLQELAPEQAEAVAAVLPHGALAPATDHHGMGVALRAPARLVQRPLARRALHCAELDPKEWPGLAAPLGVWNAHVWAPHTWPAPRSLAIRRAQLRQIAAALDEAPAAPLLLVGDFNATPLWPAYRVLAARLEDAAVAQAARTGARPERTWAPWRGARRPRLLRIDHVFARGARVEALRRLPLPGSDHDALCADVALD